MTPNLLALVSGGGQAALTEALAAPACVFWPPNFF